MSDITASQVMALRQKTGLSMMDCKKALVEANGNEEQAIDILRKKGMDKMAKKSDRTTGEGVVAISGKAIVSINCETDFVARNEAFIKFAQSLADVANEKGGDAAKEEFEKEKVEKSSTLGENITLGDVQIVEAPIVGGYVHSNRKVAALVGIIGGNENVASDIAMHATAMNPTVVSPDEVSDELVAKEREIWSEQLQMEGKPSEIIEKIMIGKEKKFREESALIKQAFVKDQEKTVEQYAKENGSEVVSFVRVMA